MESPRIILFTDRPALERMRQQEFQYKVRCIMDKRKQKIKGQYANYQNRVKLNKKNIKLKV